MIAYRFFSTTVLSLAAAILAIAPAQAQEGMTDWGGFYAGVLAGYAIDTEPSSASVTPPTTITNNPGQSFTFGSYAGDERFQTPFGGVKAGYNYQYNNYVAGFEGDLTLGGFSKTRSDGESLSYVDGVDFGDFAIDNATTFKLDWLTTLSGRAGLAVGDWLVYGKLGLAVANVSTNSTSLATINDSGAGGPFGGNIPNGTYDSSARASQVRVGPVVGFGLEKMLSDTLSIGAEYAYIGLGDFTADSAASPFGGLLGGNGGASQTFSANIHTIKGSLSYHF